MNIAEFEQLLKRAIGLDAASIGSSAVERAVRTRMAAMGETDAAAYAERLQTSSSEVQELIEAVVVPETWFFRDREAFATLGRFAIDEWTRTHPDGVLRVLSLPCSTGEEAYSIAMTFLDAGLPPSRFRVDALDISRLALARARAGLYGKNSFRGSELLFRERHFTPVAQRWQINATVRAQVEFSAGNLLDPALPANREPYDVIFCRNLLIYFDRATQDRAVAALGRLLAPQGWLFVGPSETSLLLDHGFESVKVPLAFVFRRPLPAPRKHDTATAKPARKPPPSSTRATTPRARVSPPPPAAAAPRIATPRARESLADIARLADEGHLAEAARLCEQHLATNGPSAKAFYLLGLVRDAAGKHSEAAELYRKALYLEPNHHEALLHLAYLLERNGDAAGAKTLAARARRAMEKAKA